MASYNSSFTGAEIDDALARARSMLLTGAADPTTATVGTLGQTYKNTTSGALFRCVNIAGAVYTWEAVYKKSEIDTLLGAKAPQSTTYTKTEVDTALSAMGAEKSDRVDLAETNDKLADAINILSTLNPNNEAKQTVTGYDKILSLPKNAANGNATFNLKGMTAQNLVANGDFSNGTTGWSTGSGSLSASNNVLSYALNGAYADSACTTSTAIKASVNQKLYLKATMKVPAGCTLLRLYTYNGIDTKYAINITPTKTPPVFGSFATYSGIVTQTEIGTTNLRVYMAHGYADAATASGKVMEVKEVMAIDLTAIFGSGSEPDAATCDKIFANYFSGLQSAKGRGRERSVGKNLFDQGKAVANYTVSTSDGTLSALAGTYASAYIKVKPSTAYVRSSSGNYAMYDANKVFIGGGTGTTFTTTALTAYVRLATTEPTTGQFELGSTATTYEPYKSSDLYINATEPLRRVPNGTVDEQRKRSDGGYERVGRCVEYTLVAGDVVNATDYTNVTRVYTNTFANMVIPNNPSSNLMLGIGYAEGRSECLAIDYDNVNSIGKVAFLHKQNRFYFVFAKGTTLAAAQAALAGTKIVYQLATPVITPIETSGTLLSYPSGSVYWEPIVGDAGVYASGISILATGFPIVALETLSKVNYATGIETALDPSTAVIAGNGLSFTHSGLTNGDIVFFTYSFANAAPEGNKTVEYLDSRTVVKDSVTNKYYKIGFAVADGVISLTKTEVT